MGDTSKRWMPFILTVILVGPLVNPFVLSAIVACALVVMWGEEE